MQLFVNINHIFKYQKHTFQTIMQSEDQIYFLINHKLTRVYVLYRHAKSLRHASPQNRFTLKKFETTTREIGLIIFRDCAYNPAFWPQIVLYQLALSYHVPLICDIYCAHAHLSLRDFTVFGFRKLRAKRLIFLMNCRSNLTVNNRNRAKKIRNK